MLKFINGLFPLFYAAEGGESAAAPVAEPALVVPAPAQVEPAVSVVDGAVDLSKPETIRELTPEQRDAVLFGTKSEMQVEPAPVEPTPAPVAPPAEPVPPVEPEPEPDSTAHPKNVRISGIEDPKAAAFAIAFAAALRANPHANPIDVAREYGYDLPAVEAAPEPTQTEIAAPPHIVAARAEIEALDAQLTAEITDGVLLGPELRTKENAITQRKIQLGIMEYQQQEADRRAVEQDQGHRQTAREASKAAALVQFPTANDANSVLGKEITRQFLEIQANPDDPRNTDLAKDNGPAWLVQQAAAELGTTLKALGLSDEQVQNALKGKPTAEAKGPVTPDPTVIPPRKPAVPAPVPRTVLVTSPGGNPAPVVPAMTPAQAIEAARNNPALREAVLGFASGRKL